MWFLRKMAWPISLIYGAVVHVRNWLFDKGIFTSQSFPVSTICVGNLSVGGTGKTPMIEFLISRMQDTHRLAVLSRGYKRKSKGFQLGDSHSTVEVLGDEPFQIQRKFPKIAVAVDADRQNGITQLQRMVKPSLILLDDAFQHRRVKPSFSVLLTTYATPYFNDWYLPTGGLRDAKMASKRADIIVVTKCPPQFGKDEMESFTRQLKKSEGQLVLFSTLVYQDALCGQKDSLNLDDLKNRKFTLVTGIANPKPLVDHLKEKGLVFEHLKFTDHHAFTSSEIRVLNQKGLIVTTEKDYVRLRDKVQNLCYIKVEHQFLAGGEQKLLEGIRAKITPYR